jgi:hypothetical protein
MDLSDALAKLYAEKESLIRAITALEGLQNGAQAPRSRRGRKSMNPDERQEVSARMKKYWASRRMANAAHSGS